MRKIAVVALVIVLAVSGPAFSQNKKGNVLIGTYIGSAGLNFGDSEYSYPPSAAAYKYKSTGINIGVGPVIGYYFADTVVAGIDFNVYFNTGKNDSSYTGSTATATDKYSYIGLSIGPFLRLYFGDNNGKGMPFIQFKGGVFLYPSYDDKYTPSSGSAYEYKYNSYSSWNAGVDIGYEHYINPYIGIQYFIGYEYNHNKFTATYDYVTGSDSTYTGTSSSHGINFGIGLQIHLGGSK